MCEPATIATIAAITGIAGAGVSAYGQYKTGQATKAANEAQAQIYANNAAIAQQNAQMERQQGIEDSRKVRIQTIQKISAQRAAMAANGIDIGAGTASDITADTAQFGELDALTTMYNSERRAMNYQNNSSDFIAQSDMSRKAGKNAAISGNISALGSGLSGVSQVSGKWSNYKGAY